MFGCCLSAVVALRVCVCIFCIYWQFSSCTALRLLLIWFCCLMVMLVCCMNQVISAYQSVDFNIPVSQLDHLCIHSLYYISSSRFFFCALNWSLVVYCIQRYTSMTCTMWEIRSFCGIHFTNVMRGCMLCNYYWRVKFNQISPRNCW